MSGKVIFNAKMETNTFVIHQEGENTVQFADGQEITFYWPILKISGIIFGDRCCRYSHYLKYIDEDNGIKAIVKMGEGKDDSFFSKKKND
mmetsp:Transcript_28150/g.24925  ORF Transcript_28150/g.24925 Transcript_28150/m.24925 type:complete len:90 (-) Transcript_28150:252-521(-)